MHGIVCICGGDRSEVMAWSVPKNEWWSVHKAGNCINGTDFLVFGSMHGMKMTLHSCMAYFINTNVYYACMQPAVHVHVHVCRQ